MIRRLLVTIRDTSTGDVGRYVREWDDLGRAVAAAGGNAWRFQDPANPARRLEFIEWKQAGPDDRLPDQPAVRSRLDALDAAGRILSRETWEESAP